MDFALSEEQTILGRTVRTFLERTWPESAVRSLAEGDEPFDGALWARMSGELGLPGLAIPEEFGGSGYGPVEQAVVLEELGRALFGGPYFATVVLAAGALLASGDELAQKTWLPPIAAGTLTATVALTGAVEARPAGDGAALTGVMEFVVDGATADLVLVSTGDTLYAVQGDDPTLTRTRVIAMDPTRALATLAFDATPATLVGTRGAAAPALERVLDLAYLALAAEQVGGAGRCLDLSVEHAKTRKQFGSAIGTFQAVKHLCSDMLLRLEGARAAVHYGSWAAAEGTDDLHLLAAVAKSYCSEAFSRTAADTIQVHGGIGFTWEHPAHLYFKRAKSSELFLGRPATHRAVIAKALLDG